MKYFKLILLLLFLTASTLLPAQLKEFEVRELPAPSGIALTMDHPDCAQLVIHSQIDGLRFESNMAGIREQRHLSREDKYLIFITPIRQIITVKASGFIEEQLSTAMKLKPKERRYFAIDERDLFIERDKGSFLLESIPSGALIQIDGIPSFKERTPYMFDEYFAMNYPLKLSLEGYEDFEFTMKILAGQEGEESIRLRARFAELDIKSEPAGSVVYLNNRYLGRTPLSLLGKETSLDSGEYSMKIIPSSGIYNTIEKQVKLVVGELFSETFVHQDQRRWLKLSANLQPFEAYLDGKRNTDLESGKEVFLDGDSAELKVIFVGKDSDKYPPYQKDLKLLAGAHHVEDIKFSALKATVDLLSDHNNIKLAILNKNSGETVYEGMSNRSIELFPDVYSVEAKKKGFYVLERDIVINENPTQSHIFNPVFNSHRSKLATAELITSLGIVATLGGTALYTKSVSDSYYEDYQKANLSSEVQWLMENTEKWDKYTSYLVAAEMLATGWLIKAVTDYVRIKASEKEVKRLRSLD